MTNRERDKRYEFVKLCSSLTKQGLIFTKGENYTLIFSKHEYRKYQHYFTKTPFVNSDSCSVINNMVHVKPKQWSDVTFQEKETAWNKHLTDCAKRFYYGLQLEK